ncbi:MAG TPA: DUF1918 domain-containing protein [Dermatophilaceae bacterium]|nr:DUF1918 domain-containing protein [Dermatophilaceae bacterium]
MRAKTGDHIILAGKVVDQPTRAGEVLEARGADGGPPYVVRWEDGHTTTMFPGPGAALRVMEAEPEGRAPELAPEQPGRLREWMVRVTIFESGEDTTATVALLADLPDPPTARGTSHRSGEDRDNPVIGDEVAVARALRRLADSLLSHAEQDIEAGSGEEDVVVRPR